MGAPARHAAGGRIRVVGEARTGLPRLARALLARGDVRRYGHAGRVEWVKLVAPSGQGSSWSGRGGQVAGRGRQPKIGSVVSTDPQRVHRV